MTERTLCQLHTCHLSEVLILSLVGIKLVSTLYSLALFLRCPGHFLRVATLECQAKHKIRNATAGSSPENKTQRKPETRQGAMRLERKTYRTYQHAALRLR